MGKYIIKEQKIKDRDIERVRKIAHYLSRRFKLKYTIYKCVPIIKVYPATERQLSGWNSDYYDSFKAQKKRVAELEKEVTQLKAKIKANKQQPIAKKEKFNIVKYLKSKL